MEGERKKSMYRKDSEGWLKHTDFIILDMICLQLAYVLAYAISGYGFNPYETIIYRNMAVFLELADLVMIFAYGTMKSVLKRGYYRDFVVTLNHAIMVGALAILYLFLLQQGQDFSRLTLMLTIIIYLVMTYVVRELWKKLLRKQMKDGGERKLLIVTSEDVAEQVVLSMQENNYARFSLAGVAVIDADWTGREIHGVPVVANEETAAMYVCQEWIDEVLIVVSEVLPYPAELIEQLSETGVTIHLNLAKITNVPGKKQFVEKIIKRCERHKMVKVCTFTQFSLLPVFASPDVIYVRPTKTDGDSLSVREALALGARVVASNVAPRPEGTEVYEFSEGSKALSETVVRVMGDIHSSKAKSNVSHDYYEDIKNVYNSLEEFK